MSEYKNRHVPGKFCPKCNAQLTVNEQEHKTVNPDNPFYVRRLVCPCFVTTGCSYKEKFTEEVKAALDAQVIEIDIEF